MGNTPADAMEAAQQACYGDPSDTTSGLVERVARAARDDELAKAAEAVKNALIPTPATLTNDWAFGWDHARDKALLALRALATKDQR